MFLDTAPIRQDDRGVYGKTSPGGITQNFFHDIAHLMFLHLLPRHGRDGFPDTGIQEPKVFVYLRRGSHRRTRVTGVHLLFDGNGRGNTFDIVAFRLAHTPQELTSIGRKALHIAALPLRLQRIKANDDFHLPERPVITTSLSLGISTSIFFRLLIRAPLMNIELFSDIMMIYQPDI